MRADGLWRVWWRIVFASGSILAIAWLLGCDQPGVDLGRWYPEIRDDARAWHEWAEGPLSAECEETLADLRVVHVSDTGPWCLREGLCGCAAWTDAGPGEGYSETPLIIVWEGAPDPRAVIIHEVQHHLYECAGRASYVYDSESGRWQHVGRVWRWLPPTGC